MMRWLFWSLGIVFALACTPLVSGSGDIIWQKTFGGPNAEEWGYSLDETGSGGIIVCGIAFSQDANVSGNHGNGDVWVICLNQTGETLWQRCYGGNQSDYGLAIHTTKDNGAIIIGTTGSYDGDVTGYHGGGDVWVIKIDQNGAIQWEKAYGGSDLEEGGDILQTTDGGYIFTGYTMSNDGDVSGNHGGGDLWVVRLDSSGNILWQKCYGGTKRESGSGITELRDGSYVICGNSYSSDGDLTKNQGSSDIWIIKIDQSGKLIWQKSMGGSELDWGHTVTEAVNGDIYAGGVTSSSNGDITGSHGAGDVWIARLSPEGETRWSKNYGGNFSDNIWKVEPSPRGGVFFIGDSYSVDGDVTGNHGDSDIWTGEVDQNGTLLWQKCYGGSSYESGSWLRLLQDGNLAITGTTRSHDGDITDYRGSGDLWVAKIAVPKNLLTTNTTGISSETIKIVNASTNTTTNRTLVVIQGESKIPTDPDKDGLYEDLNGNGVLDLQDPIVLFKNLDWIRNNEPIALFDFNQNGRIDAADVTKLMKEIG